MELQVRDKNAQNLADVKVSDAEAAVRTAAEEWIGGYYVADHSACGQANIPNTEGDTFGFVNNMASWQKRNFVYANADVWSWDFQSGSDYYSSPGLPAKFDGVDSVVIGYISTHGVTSGSVFTMCMGGTGHGGCTVSSNQMSFGENNLRYMFFSACQSVLRTNPGNVWFGAARGVRALFGYHTNSVDSPDYGKFFFENWKKNQAKTTYSFLDASWRISHDQDPVAAWFGPDQASADGFRENEGYFQHDPITANWISYRWYTKKSLREGIYLLRVPELTVFHKAPRAEVDAALMIETLGGGRPSGRVERREEGGDNVSHSTGEGTTLVYNRKSGASDLTFPGFFDGSAVTFGDDEAVRAAAEHVASVHRGGRWDALAGLGNAAVALEPSAVRYSYAAGADREGRTTQQSLTQTTVVFRPTINGVASIGTGGVLEVTLNGRKEVCRVRSVLRAVESVSHEGEPVDVAALRERAERRAVEEVQAQPYVNDVRVVRTEFGLFAADEAAVQAESRLAFRMLVEYQTGIFSKWVEKIYDVRDLR